MKITRRSALLTGAAAVSVVAPVAMVEYPNRAEEHEPLKDLWREYQRRTAIHAEIRDRAHVAYEADDLEGCSRIEDEAGEFDREFLVHGVERQISMSHARTIEGALIQARMLLAYVDDGIMANGQDANLAHNLVAGLERLAGRSS